MSSRIYYFTLALFLSKADLLFTPCLAQELQIKKPIVSVNVTDRNNAIQEAIVQYISKTLVEPKIEEMNKSLPEQVIPLTALPESVKSKLLPLLQRLQLTDKNGNLLSDQLQLAIRIPKGNVQLKSGIEGIRLSPREADGATKVQVSFSPTNLDLDQIELGFSYGDLKFHKLSDASLGLKIQVAQPTIELKIAVPEKGLDLKVESTHLVSAKPEIQASIPEGAHLKLGTGGEGSVKLSLTPEFSKYLEDKIETQVQQKIGEFIQDPTLQKTFSDKAASVLSQKYSEGIEKFKHEALRIPMGLPSHMDISTQIGSVLSKISASAEEKAPIESAEQEKQLAFLQKVKVDLAPVDTMHSQDTLSKMQLAYAAIQILFKRQGVMDYARSLSEKDYRRLEKNVRELEKHWNFIKCDPKAEGGLKSVKSLLDETLDQLLTPIASGQVSLAKETHRDLSQLATLQTNLIQNLRVQLDPDASFIGALDGYLGFNVKIDQFADNPDAPGILCQVDLNPSQHSVITADFETDFINHITHLLEGANSFQFVAGKKIKIPAPPIVSVVDASKNLYKIAFQIEREPTLIESLRKNSIYEVEIQFTVHPAADGFGIDLDGFETLRAKETFYNVLQAINPGDIIFRAINPGNVTSKKIVNNTVQGVAPRFKNLQKTFMEMLNLEVSEVTTIQSEEEKQRSQPAGTIHVEINPSKKEKIRAE